MTEILPVAVVLGSGINLDGTASAVTELRARQAAMLAKSVPLQRIIASGFGPPGMANSIGKSEAAVMAEIIRDQLDGAVCLPEICLEAESVDTFSNVLFSVDRFLRQCSPTRLYVVTSPFHMPRSVYMFERVLQPDWLVMPSACAEWEHETRQAGAEAAMERARQFFDDLPRGDIDAALLKYQARQKPLGRVA